MCKIQGFFLIVNLYVYRCGEGVYGKVRLPRALGTAISCASESMSEVFGRGLRGGGGASGYSAFFAFFFAGDFLAAVFFTVGFLGALLFVPGFLPRFFFPSCPSTLCIPGRACSDAIF